MSSVSEAGRHAPACTGFWLWALSGALVTLTVLTALTIGIFLLPFGAAAVVFASRRAGPAAGRLGLLGGLGLTVAGIGVLHLGDNQFDPGPWLRVGGGTLGASVLLFAAARRGGS